MKVEVMFFKKVTVENWTMVKVVGIAVLIEVETEVIVLVFDMVLLTVLGLVVVLVFVVTWMGTKRVDLVIEVKMVDFETVVKSVTTVGTNKVGILPFISKALLAEFKVMILIPLGRDAPLDIDPPNIFKTAPDISVPLAELIKDDSKSHFADEDNTFILFGGYMRVYSKVISSVPKQETPTPLSYTPLEETWNTIIRDRPIIMQESETFSIKWILKIEYDGWGYVTCYYF